MQLPEALISSLSKLDHFDPEAFVSVHASGHQPVSIHMNPGKPVLQNGSWPEDFIEQPFQISGKVPWAPDAWYLKSRPSFTLDPLFHAGAYYVQEASGMFLAFAIQQITDLSKKIKVLDLCAAPGGKSTWIQSLISSDSLLVSNEVIKTRVPVLYQNMTKWGRANGIISNNDPVQFKQLAGFFDLMLIDAPCSGSGLFRKDPAAAKTWSPETVLLCCHRQERIIADAWDTLKEGGYLIYSTCSYSKEENEDMLDWIFKNYNCESVPLTPDPDWHIVETISDQASAHGYRFYPYELAGEGFFLSVIRKKEEASTVELNHSNSRAVKKGRLSEKISGNAVKQLNQWIPEGSIQYVMVADSIHAIPAGIVNDFNILKNVLYLKKAGIRAGKTGESGWIPDHELALADILNDKPATMNLDKNSALSYLRGEAFDMGNGGKGWHLVRFQGKGLGWVKLLDKRMNNYYPKSWRIRL